MELEAPHAFNAGTAIERSAIERTHDDLSAQEKT